MMPSLEFYPNCVEVLSRVKQAEGRARNSEGEGRKGGKGGMEGQGQQQQTEAAAAGAGAGAGAGEGAGEGPRESPFLRAVVRLSSEGAHTSPMRLPPRPPPYRTSSER
jgi:hypothetical protein